MQDDIAPDTGQDRTGQVRSVVRSLTLMRYIAASDNGLTLTEVAEKSQLPASTTHRLLTTLESERFVRFDNSAGLWQVGVNAFMVGTAFTRTRNLLSLAKPFLRRLMDQTGETSNVFVETSGMVVCLDQVESRFTMRAITQVGGRIPMHCSASGKVILAHLSPERRDALLGDQELVSITPNTITDPQRLLRQLEDVKRLGIAIDNEEHAEGLRCVAAPIFGENGLPVAAVSVSGPVSRITNERVEEISRTVREIARAITTEFGGTLQTAKRA
ncbi:MAG: IclR family transcriptional regulator C-terminal domain-containing protein [Pseudomonadota bacterium]